MMTGPFDWDPGDRSPYGRTESADATLRRSMPGLAESLESVQRQAFTIREITDRAAAGSPPLAAAEGTDASETATVTVGLAGLPESLRVVPDWERRLPPERLAAAITEAALAARSRQMMAAADEMQYLARREDGRTDGTLRDHEGPAGAVDFGHEPLAAGAASLDSLAEKALRLFSEVEQFRPVPAQGTGRAAGGRFTVVLSAEGAVACSADPQWVSGRSPAELAGAFREAVREARSALAAQQPPASPAAALKGLFDETIALLRDPRRLT